MFGKPASLCAYVTLKYGTVGGKISIYCCTF